MNVYDEENMIPKIIHYCWFGGGEKSDEIKKYIVSWEKYCPDFIIKEWNEYNFDINENDYCREAYEAKKWAFVTDYVRLKVLYKEGGFYMDTDVEVVKSLEPLRIYDAVSGYESKVHIPTGVIGACSNNEWIGMLLHDYDKRHFFKADGRCDQTTNVEVITRLTVEKYHIELNGEKTPFGRNMIFLPFDYLCAKSYKTGEVYLTGNTYTIHHFAGSWLDNDMQKYEEAKRKYFYTYKNLLPVNLAYTLAKIRAAFDLGGGNEIFVRILKKIFSKRNQ